jgi:hypothetical protein
MVFLELQESGIDRRPLGREIEAAREAAFRAGLRRLDERRPEGRATR